MKHRIQNGQITYSGDRIPNDIDGNIYKNAERDLTPAQHLELGFYTTIDSEPAIDHAKQKYGEYGAIDPTTHTRVRAVVAKTADEQAQYASDQAVAAGFTYSLDGVDYVFDLTREIGGLNMLLAEAGLLRYGQNSVRFPDITGAYIVFTKAQFQTFVPLFAAAFNAVRGGS